MQYYIISIPSCYINFKHSWATEFMLGPSLQDPSLESIWKHTLRLRWNELVCVYVYMCVLVLVRGVCVCLCVCWDRCCLYAVEEVAMLFLIVVFLLIFPFSPHNHCSFSWLFTLMILYHFWSYSQSKVTKSFLNWDEIYIT